MGLVRSRDTKPEMIIRRLVHSMGYRYRLHAPELPGRPDLVFRPRKRVVFVHDCSAYHRLRSE
ncbi:very short patch repair endonuclease [Erythrobacter aureus]|nr:very short patch repair endonuclease [Erythrobacter aureus]